ncbi:MAG: DUF72 domain-containing protein [Gemmatimonadales bacterium]|nr:MAG: DUF72 domain-containing protein [Gemmatimonadales bacterium]
MGDPPLQPELFSSGPAAPVDLAARAPELAGLAGALSSRLRLGTSSWSFPGWEGLVYDRAARPGVLARHGLAAYARHPLLRAVGVDRSYYEAPSRAVFEGYRRQVPDDFRFMVKADRRLTTPEEPFFLDPQWARERVLAPAHQGLGETLGVLLLQFSPLPPERVGGPRRFAERLYRFLRDLASPVPVAVELRTPALLTPDYGQALRHGGAVHGYVAHPRMLALDRQQEIVPPRSGEPVLVRWMLAPGASYEATREAWAPFDALRAPDPGTREVVAGLVRAGLQGGSDVVVIVNNKAEGSSPLSIEALARHLASGAGPAPGRPQWEGAEGESG